MFNIFVLNLDKEQNKFGLVCIQYANKCKKLPYLQQGNCASNSIQQCDSVEKHMIFFFIIN